MSKPHDAFAAASPSEKFAKLLLSWSTKRAQDDGSAQMKLTLTHEEVAKITGTTRETVSRLYSEFKKKQLMQMKGAKIVQSSCRRGAVEHSWKGHWFQQAKSG